METISYVYQADHHCPDCTRDAGMDKEDAIDSEGNDVYPFGGWEEGPLDEYGNAAPIICGTCLEIIREASPEWWQVYATEYHSIQHDWSVGSIAFTIHEVKDCGNVEFDGWYVQDVDHTVIEVIGPFCLRKECEEQAIDRVNDGRIYDYRKMVADGKDTDGNLVRIVAAWDTAVVEHEANQEREDNQ